MDAWMVQTFIGQVMGTSVGSKVFTEHGWRPDASLNLAFTGFTLLILFLRGPHCPRYTWFGWQGGCELRKSRVLAQQEAAQDAAAGEKDGAAGGVPARERGDDDDKSENNEKGAPHVEVLEKGNGQDRAESLKVGAELV